VGPLECARIGSAGQTSMRLAPPPCGGALHFRTRTRCKASAAARLFGCPV
jgi:hypothetical protein